MTPEEKTALRQTCHTCGKRLKSIRGRKDHERTAHSDNDESMASIFVAAGINRAMGVPNEDWIEEMTS